MGIIFGVPSLFIRRWCPPPPDRTKGGVSDWHRAETPPAGLKQSPIRRRLGSSCYLGSARRFRSAVNCIHAQVTLVSGVAPGCRNGPRRSTQSSIVIIIIVLHGCLTVYASSFCVMLSDRCNIVTPYGYIYIGIIYPIVSWMPCNID